MQVNSAGHLRDECSSVQGAARGLTRALRPPCYSVPVFSGAPSCNLTFNVLCLRGSFGLLGVQPGLAVLMRTFTGSLTTTSSSPGGTEKDDTCRILPSKSCAGGARVMSVFSGQPA